MWLPGGTGEFATTQCYRATRERKFLLLDHAVDIGAWNFHLHYISSRQFIC